MNKLNVFNNHWSPWKYPSNWVRNTRLFFRQFKWAYQRVTKGYCDPDYWDMDVHLAELMAQMLKELADKGHGYPGTEEFPTYEAWQAYLYKIIEKLRFFLNDEMENPYEKAWLKTFENKDICDALNNKTPEEEEITKKYLDIEHNNELKQDKALHEALDMIVHCFRSLWD